MTKIFFFSSFINFTWPCLSSSILFSLSSCWSFIRLDLRSIFFYICQLESFRFSSLFLGQFSTFCHILLFIEVLFSFKSSAFWLRILWIIFCLHLASSFNDKFSFLRNCSLTWSSSTVLLFFVQILSFSIYIIIWWYFSCIVERSCRIVYTSSIKKAFKATIFALISPNSLWWCDFNEYILSDLDWIIGVFWLPLKCKLLLRFFSKLLTRISWVPMRSKLLV